MDDRLGEIQIRTAMATPAPLEVGIVDPELDPVQWFKEHLELADNPTGDVWVVWCPKHPKSERDPEGRPTHAVLAAITGNGPTSEHNAEFFAHARDDVPWLIDQVKQLQAETERLRDLVKGLWTLGRFYVLHPASNTVECEFCKRSKQLNGQPFVHDDDCPIGAAEKIGHDE